MKKPDDCSLAPNQLEVLRKHARKLLEAAGALGTCPTPLSDIMSAARVEVADEEVLSESFLRRLRREAGDALRRAIGKVIGVVHIAAGIIYIDRTIHPAKLPFIKLHETAHAYLPWQAKAYAVTEESKASLDPFVADEFERQANVFAVEVMFQLDKFTKEAYQHELDILVPVKLSKNYGSSIYMAIRRYVAQHHLCCAVLVLDPPVVQAQIGFAANLRRVICSESFRLQFGNSNWPEAFTPGDTIGSMIPIGKRRMSGKIQFALTDDNGMQHECFAEAFTNGHQVFVLIHAVSALTRVSVALL